MSLDRCDTGVRTAEGECLGGDEEEGQVGEQDCLVEVSWWSSCHGCQATSSFQMRIPGTCNVLEEGTSTTEDILLLMELRDSSVML